MLTGSQINPLHASLFMSHVRSCCCYLVSAIAVVLTPLFCQNTTAFAEEPSGKLSPIERPAERPIQDRASPNVDPIRSGHLSPSEREKLYEQIIRDAELLERQSSQFRRVTRLLRPTVVHIDTKKPALRPKKWQSQRGRGWLWSDCQSGRSLGRDHQSPCDQPSRTG